VVRACLDLLLPPVCPACRGAGEGLCVGCDQGLQRRPRLGCRRCGEVVAIAGASCGSEHAELRHVARLVAPWRFAGTGGALVRRCKLDGDLGAGRCLVRAMANAWRQQIGDARDWRRAAVVPVPLHPARRRQRGFDQTAWLATELSTRLGLGAAVGVLRRTRATLPQGDPRVLSREKNVEGAFAVARPRAIAGAAVVLIDDVFTSGATARCCAAALRAAGARTVAMLTACRS
jgi:ComF family protein